MSKSQLLQIYYKEDQGLIFKWNYSNTSVDNVFFRHIIVLYSQEKNKAKTYLKKYIKKIKPGDLYYIIYVNTKQEVKNIGWKQKMVNEDIHERSFIRENITRGYLDNILRQVEHFYEEFSEPIVLTFLLDSVEEKDDLEEKITNGRYNQKYDFLVAFFVPIEKITLSYGYKISTFSSLDDEIENQINFFLNCVRQAAILNAKVTIECTNGAITSMIDTNWRTTSFNQIEKTYRGPSAKYDKDTLFFFNKSLQDTSENLNLKLEFVTLDKKKFQAEKRFTVLSSKEFYQKTFTTEAWCKSYHSNENDLWLTENPFISFTVIKFEQNTCNSF